MDPVGDFLATYLMPEAIRDIVQTWPMAVLVTGGAGYIGSHTVRLLREQGRDVVAFDSLEFGHAAAVGDVPLVRGGRGGSRCA